MKHSIRPVTLMVALSLALAACGQPSAPQSSSVLPEGSAAPVVSGESIASTAPSESTASAPNRYPEFILGETETTVTFLDCQDKQITLTKNPKRVVSCYNSMLDMWYLCGGEAVARVSGKENVPEAAKALPEVGSLGSPSIEAILAADPDLVLLSRNMDSQLELIPLLEESQIEYLLADLKTDPYGSFDQYLYLFAKVLGHEDVYEAEGAKVKADCDAIIAKAQAIAPQPTVAVLYASKSSVKLETDGSQTGQMLHLMGAQNIVRDDEIKVEGETRIDFSMEVLVARDPEYLLICTMGDVDACKANIDKNLAADAAWGQLSAVKAGRVIYLPKEYTVYKPNAAYPKAFEAVAKAVYPDFAV
ncbi:MAG: ABC transporter substrate-binding protein [Oscillospiraceae bacterium]